MSNAFTNFLGGVTAGVFGTQADLRDYQHANRLYVRDSYARAPKFGFLYFVSFNLDTNVTLPKKPDVVTAGMLVKRIDLPKFQIATETINQYNRKTVVQTGLKYQPISLEFHDDNSDITNALWTTYFRYYYQDNAYGYTEASASRSNPAAFGDTKYGETDYAYGFKTVKKAPLFKSIDIYVLHQHKYTQFTLVNPIVTEWSHDNLDQNDSTKILANRMSIAYETVLYNKGSISKSNPANFATQYYDTTPSPLSIGGNGNNSLFSPGGIIDGASSVFGSLASGNILGALIQGNTLVRNAKTITTAGLKQEGYSMITGALGKITPNGNQPGGVSSPIQTGSGAAGFTGVNLFSNKNSSVNGLTTAIPSTLTGKT